MQAAVNTPAPRRERSGSNLKFANDGSYESVELLLHKLASRCFARAQALGLGMTFDDVRQEMNVSYLLARNTWDAERGVLFSTYLTRCCYWNFNETIRRPSTERRHLGLVNFSDMRVVQNRAEGDDLDVLEIIDTEGVTSMYAAQEIAGDEIGGYLSGDIPAPLSANPEAFLEDLQDATRARDEALEQLRALTPSAKRVIMGLLRAHSARADSQQKLPRLSALLRDSGFTASEAKRVRQEIVKAFGVKVC